MSQLIGQNFKTRIPQFSDDASIEEALKVYHYGVDNYTVQPIPNDSIEGHFRSLDTRVDSLESQVGTIESGIVKYTSLAADPNIIVGETISVVPLTIRAIASQTTSLQAWQNSSSNTVASVSAGGYIATANYIGIGTLTATSSIAANINIINASNKGIVIRSAASQTANLQEWQNSAGNLLSYITSSGSVVVGPTASGNFSIFANILNASNKGIVVKSAPGQSSNLQEWQNSAGAVLTSVKSDGSIFSSLGIRAIGNYNSSFGGNEITGVTLVAHTNISSNIGFVVRSSNSQTANLQEWQNSAGAAQSWISADGSIFIKNQEIDTATIINPLMLMGA